MATTRMETTHGITYSVSRVLEVTTWQSDDAVSLCCLTHGSCHWTQISSGYIQQWGLLVAHPKKDGFHLSMPSPHDWPDSQFLCCTRVYSLCDTLWPKVQSHSDDSPVHITGPCSACALAQAHSTMSCIHLALLMEQKKVPKVAVKGVWSRSTTIMFPFLAW